MASITITVPDGDIVDTIQERALSLGFPNARAMVISYLKDQYRLQKRLTWKADAVVTSRQVPNEPSIT